MTRRRTLAAALVAGVAAPLLLTASPVRAQALPDVPGCERASAEAPLLVEVTTLAPRAPQRADEPFQVSGRLVNCGREPLRDLEVRLGVGERLDTRARVARADEEPVAGRRVLTQDGELALPSGASRPFDLRLLTDDLGLGRRNGVFPLTVQGRARVGEESQRGQVGLAHTFVPWFPDGPIAPTRIAWVLPLVDQPHRGPGEVMLDDDLDALLEDDETDRGRLQRALLAGTEGSKGACDPTAAPPEGTPRAPSAGCRGDAVPMTYALDPDLLYSVEAMARPGGYRLLEDGEPVDRERSENAEQWLVALRTAAAEGSDVLALPYGDPDVVALTRIGSPVPDDVQTLRRLGSAETRRLLGTDPLTSVAWLPPGPVGGSVDALAGGEVRTLLVDPAALPELPADAFFTPSARTTLASQAGAVDALVADDALTRLLEPDPTSSTWQGTRLAEQRWIAEAAALTAERPSVSRTVLVAPRREADLLPALAIGAVHDTGRLPFLCPVSLRTAAAGTEQCAPGPVADVQGPAEATPRGAPLPSTEGDRELDPEVVRAIGEVRAAADQFTDQVLIAGSEQAKAAKARLLRARGRAASTAWRERPREGRQMLRLLAEDVTDLRGKVRLLNAQPVLLTSNVGTVSLTVENGLDQPVNVGVGLPTSSAARVESEDTALQEVPPRRAVDVQVRVEARTSGRFEVLATLLDAEGRPFGPEVELEVRSTQYGRVALAVTGVAAAVLLVAAGARITRRAMRRTVPSDEPDVTPAAPGSGV